MGGSTFFGILLRVSASCPLELLSVLFLLLPLVASGLSLSTLRLRLLLFSTFLPFDDVVNSVLVGDFGAGDVRVLVSTGLNVGADREYLLSSTGLTVGVDDVDDVDICTTTVRAVPCIAFLTCFSSL